MQRTIETRLLRKYAQEGYNIDPVYIQDMVEDMYRNYRNWVNEGYSSEDALNMAEQLHAEKYPARKPKSDRHNHTGYSTEERRPGGSYASSSRGPAEIRSYNTEYREPGRSTHHCRTDPCPVCESRPYTERSGRYGESFTYTTYTAYSESQHVSQGRYQTEERRPQASSRAPYFEGRRTDRSHLFGEQAPRRTDRSHLFAGDEPHPFTDARQRRHAEEERRSHHSSRATYNTEERRPGASSHSYSRAQSPSRSQRRAHSPSRSHGRAQSPPRSHRRAQDPPHAMGKTPETCFYKVLGVPRDATADEIKKAYRKLSMKWHPDRAQGTDKDKATQMMMEINNANDVLSDETKRAKYDHTGMTF